MRVIFILSAFFLVFSLNAQTYTVPASASDLEPKNVFVGFNAGVNLASIGYSTLVGYHAGATGGQFHTPPTSDGGQYNTFMGYFTGDHNTGSSNSYFGTMAGSNIGSGTANSCFGSNSSTSASGSYNTGIGHGSRVGGSGSNNTVVGSNSGNGIVTGSNNTFIGAGVRTVGFPDFSNTVILSAGTNLWRMFVDSTGKTTIGLPGAVTDYAPTAKLDIYGDLRVRNLPVSTENTYFLSTDGLGHVKKQLLNMTGAPSNLLLTGNVLTLSNPLTPGNNVTLPNIYSVNGTLTSERTVAMNNKRLVFNTLADGKIYIGNTGPAFPANYATVFPTLTSGNYKLLVEGGILTEKVKVALEGTPDWADYVFANDYKLMPLQEVETFVKENKHLPGIESADELVKGGLDLGDMQAKQMGKIEELTLYVIEQNKTLEKQNKEIEELKAQMKMLMEKK